MKNTIFVIMLIILATYGCTSQQKQNNVSKNAAELNTITNMYNVSCSEHQKRYDRYISCKQLKKRMKDLEASESDTNLN